MTSRTSISPSAKRIGPRRGSHGSRTSSTRAAVLAAALDVFTSEGFAAARMDAIATRAGVAKGTVYLYVASKEALFEAIVAETIVPVLRDVTGQEPEADEPTRAWSERLLVGLWRRLHEGRGAEVIHLVIAEGPRFPQLAEGYFRAVIEPGLDLARSIAGRAQARGEFVSAAATRFPLLWISPALVGVLWSRLFARHEPLDVEALIQGQLDMMFGPSAEKTRLP